MMVKIDVLSILRRNSRGRSISRLLIHLTNTFLQIKYLHRARNFPGNIRGLSFPQKGWVPPKLSWRRWLLSRVPENEATGGRCGVGGKDASCLADLCSADFGTFAGVVWLVAVIVGTPMWHVQRLEVGSGPA